MVVKVDRKWDMYKSLYVLAIVFTLILSGCSEPVTSGLIKNAEHTCKSDNSEVDWIKSFSFVRYTNIVKCTNGKKIDLDVR